MSATLPDNGSRFASNAPGPAARGTQRSALLETAHASAPPAVEIEAAVEFARLEKAAATRRAYRTDFDVFRAWCTERRVSAIPATPQTVAAFLAYEAARRRRPATISRRVAAIRYAHKLAGLPLPTDDEHVRATMRGIRRALGAAPKKKAPATVERILAMAPKPTGRLASLRDRALLLLGFASALRRSELVALNVEDVEVSDAGLRLTIRQSKTDQVGQGQVVAVPRGYGGVPSRRSPDVARCGRYHRRRDLPADWEGQPNSGQAVDGPQRGRNRQKSRRSRRPRSRVFCRPFPAFRVSNQCCCAQRFDL
jgi:integrase